MVWRIDIREIEVDELKSSKAQSFHSNNSSSKASLSGTSQTLSATGTNTTGGMMKRTGVSIKGQPVRLMKYTQTRTIEFTRKTLHRLHIVTGNCDESPQICSCVILRQLTN